MREKLEKAKGSRPLLRARRPGFTLVEILIVVVVMAIIAGAVAPTVESAIQDSKRSAALDGVHNLTAVIERYKAEHTGQIPTHNSATIPNLFQTTNVSGAVGAGSGFTLGPYLNGSFPVNPINDSNVVTKITSVPTAATIASSTGWLYLESRGQIWAGEAVTTATVY